MVYRNHLLGVHRRCHRLWESFEQQLERLKEVFGRLKEANLKLKPRKCSLFRREVEFLGHVVSSEGIAMQGSKVKVVNTWPTPKSLT